MNDFRSNIRARLPNGLERLGLGDKPFNSDIANRMGPIGLVSNAMESLSTFIQSSDSTAEIVEPIETQDLPTSPVMSTPELGDAPVLALDAEVEAAQPEEMKPPVIVLNSQDEQTAVPLILKGNTVIPKGWTFKGEVKGPEDMTFECNLIGNVENTAENSFVALGQDCQSQGNVTGKKIFLKGQHNGIVNGSGGQVVVESTSKITGELMYTTIQMNGGVHNFQLKYVPAVNGDAELSR